MVIVIMYYAYAAVQSGNFDFGLFTGLVVLSGYLTQLMLQSTNKFKDLTNNFTHVEKLRNLFDTTPEIT
ncbi:MAG: ABC transporter ATP-binding protein [Candidatus Peribacteria bacterium]|nr:MAG: ABC transporter ATP-binding protein [Candidatus Peribacteria bacterium]